MDYLIRAARSTDVDRLVALWHEALPPYGIQAPLRSARHAGCTVAAAALPDDPDERDRWDRLGFSDGAPRMERPVAAERAAARQS